MERELMCVENTMIGGTNMRAISGVSAILVLSAALCLAQSNETPANPNNSQQNAASAGTSFDAQRNGHNWGWIGLLGLAGLGGLAGRKRNLSKSGDRAAHNEVRRAA
jgi:hypothetical protein